MSSMSPSSNSKLHSSSCATRGCQFLVAAAARETDLATEGIGLVDLGSLGELAVGFEIPGLVGLVVASLAIAGEEADQWERRRTVYFWITSALSSWKSRRERRTMSPWLIQTWGSGVSAPVSDPASPVPPSPVLRPPTPHDSNTAAPPTSPIPPARRRNEGAEAHLLAHLSTDVSETLLAIKAHRLDPPVPEHLEDLGVLCILPAGVSFPPSLAAWGTKEKGEAEGENAPCPSSLKTNSRLSASFSFFPRLRFLPPWGTRVARVSFWGPGERRRDAFQARVRGHWSWVFGGVTHFSFSLMRERVRRERGEGGGVSGCSGGRVAKKRPRGWERREDGAGGGCSRG